MGNEIAATDIIDSVTAYAVCAVEQLWEEAGITGTREEFQAAVLRVFRVKLDRHLAALDAREPGKAALVRELFCLEQGAREVSSN